MPRFLVIALSAVMLLSACGDDATDSPFTSVTSAQSTSTAGPGTTTATTMPPPTVAETTSTAVPSTLPPPTTGTDLAWMGGFGCGVTLLDAEGAWWPYREETGALSTDQVNDVVVAADATAWVAHSLGVYHTSGSQWISVGRDGLEALALDPLSGVLWGVAYQKAVEWDGTAWVEYPYTLFGEGEFVELVKDVAVDEEGRPWVATTSTIAVREGTDWTWWGLGQGLPDFEYGLYIESLAVGSGQVWVAHTNGVLHFDGTTWVNLDPGVSQPKEILVAPDGRVWLTSWADGLASYDGAGWRVWTPDNSGLPTARTRSVAVDGQGRVWVGTTWGLAVLEGDTWRTYTMATSGLAGNCIEAIGVAGDGPPLPELQSERLGSTQGRLVNAGAPLAEAQVVLCSDEPGVLYSGEYPCSDQPFSAITTTDADGRFSFANVPEGDYEIAWTGPDGEWYSYLIGGELIAVREGVVTDIPTIDTAEG